MVEAGMPEIVDFSMQQQPLEIAAWTPGSPRLSFSRDFVQSDVFNPSTRDSAGGATSDFDFGMLALLKMDDPVSTTPMLPADELFHNGRLLPVDVASTSTATATTNLKAEDHPLLLQEAGDTIGALEQSASRSMAPLQNPQQIPKSPSSRWKELFGLKRSSRGSFSETEPLNMLNGSPSSSSSSSSRFSSASKLKLLFRSSSAGAGRGDRTTVEPCLGRSASESKVSSCCNNLQVVENNAAVVAGGKAAAADAQLLESMDENRPLSSSSQKGQQHRRRRKALVEVKGSPARMNSRASSSAPRSPNYQRLNQNSRPRLRQQQQQQQKTQKKKKNKDAWKVYNERINASNAAAAVGGGGGSVKVAEVLHMEVCMGQSMVVSKVANARIFDFMKKENKGSDAHEKAAAAKGA